MRSNTKIQALLLILSAAGLMLIAASGCSLRGEASPILEANDAPKGVEAMTLTAVSYNQLEDEVDSEPYFGCNWADWEAYLNENMRYPEKAKPQGAESSVYLSFVVDKSGMVRDVKVKDHEPYIFQQEAIRLMENSPRWNPALKDGKPVATEYFLTINFTLE